MGNKGEEKMSLVQQQNKAIVRQVMFKLATEIAKEEVVKLLEKGEKIRLEDVAKKVGILARALEKEFYREE